MTTFSCPYCFNTIEYIPPDGCHIVWVDQGFGSSGIAEKLKKELGVPSIQYVDCQCPYCEGDIVIYFAINLPNNSSFQSNSDPNDFSMEI